MKGSNNSKSSAVVSVLLKIILDDNCIVEHIVYLLIIDAIKIKIGKNIDKYYMNRE